MDCIGHFPVKRRSVEPTEIDFILKINHIK